MDRLIKLALIFLSALLVLVGILSLSWQFQHDSPIMLYIAFLMDHFAFVPYRDIFDMNMPGAYFAYYLIGKSFGYTDIGIRCADLLILITMLLVNWLWMKKISGKVAWLGSVVWGLVYLSFGPGMSLQREYLVLLPVMIGVLIFSCTPKNLFFRNLAVGLFFGIAATIKPHAAIGLIPLIAFDIPHNVRDTTHFGIKAWEFFKQIIFPMVIGFSLPFGIVLYYLWSCGAAKDFLEIATHFWPLYTHLNGEHKALYGFSRILDLLQNYRKLGGFAAWLAPAAIGSYIALYHSMQTSVLKRQIIILIGLAICYSIYPVFAGQFWAYHWLPFLFFIIQASSLCLIEQTGNAGIGRRLYPIIILAFIAFLAMPVTIYMTFLPGQKLHPPKEGRVDEIVTFLKPRLQIGDTVQPLDWTGGAVHAMLILKARIATPFIYDFYFYHDVSNEYIQGLRRTFIADLRESQPRYIIDVVGEFKPWVSGMDTTREFKELQLLLDEDYVIVFSGDGYHIYELRHDQNKN